MQESTFHWQTKANLKIYGKEWVPNQVKAVICLVHGLGEHVNRYDHLAHFFGNHGFATIGNDHHGHGQSGGTRGHVPDYECFMEEVSKLVTIATEKFPNKPLFLYGHSLGGNIVMNYALQQHPKVTGIISTGPAIEIAEETRPSALLLGFAKIMNNIYPSLQQPNGLNANDICTDSAVVKKYLADPLVHSKISVRAALALLEKADFLNNYNGTMPVPTLLMHGEKDNITAPIGSIEFAERVKENLVLKIWKGMFHEIHNEPGQKEVFQFTLSWMEKMMQK